MNCISKVMVLVVYASLISAAASDAWGRDGSEDASAQTVEDSSPSALLWRSVLIVDDLEASVEFYRQVFSLNQAYPAGVIRDPRVIRLLDLDMDAEVSLVVLISDDLSVGNLGLMQVASQQDVVVAPGLLFFKTDRLDVVFETARKSGAHIVAEPPEGSTAPRMFMFIDPWGHRVAVTERQELDVFYGEGVSSEWVDAPATSRRK